MTLGSKENYIKTGLTIGEALLALLSFILLVPFSHAN
jgi:hypothetical protein